ncbi:MAG TPA: SGNH/GDSL hydrolase family protein, partial [Candidatus Babeliaceae bacterium]|nr:SGNH/GDSL hydrolase family protein [Candidatus Babeliaceae bacterium]
LFTLFASQGLPTIRIIGDSHASFCFTNQPQAPQFEQTTYTVMDKHLDVVIYPFISKTMHRFGRDKLGFINLRTMGIQQGDTVLFTFGEIDVRCHIGKQRDLNHRDVKEVISTLIDNYIQAILINKQLFTNVTCLVATVVPPSDQAYNPFYPRYSTLFDRIEITRQVNTILKEVAQAHNIPVVDIYPLYCNADGFLDPAQSDGQVHVHPYHNHKAKDALLKILINLQLI